MAMNLQNFMLVACIFAACVKPPKHVQCSDKVTKEFVSRIVRDVGFSALGSGGFYSKNTVDQLYIDFQVVKAPNKEEAKDLLITTVAGFLNHVNQSADLKEHLLTYPMTPKEVSLSIAFVDENKKPQKGISQVYLFDGKIYYSTYNEETNDYTSIETEAF